MQTEKAAAVDGKKLESNADLDPRIDFAVRASLPEDYVDTDFVHPIVGRIFAKIEGDGEERETGQIRASLVQFGEAMDHGISTDRLGDGIDGSIA
ncbi:MAG TPA: hypothetical protein VMX38_13110, partial [Verrucomicrobiae bacterium]|nr:hypothetical protein [Verrucomicrobiae bacterium]